MSTAVTERPVRIHLAMEDGPILRSLKQVLQIIGEPTSHVFVESMTEADLVVFTDVRSIEQEYDKTRSYAYFGISRGAGVMRLPDNCLVISPSEALVCLIGIIQNIREKLTPIGEAAPVTVGEVVPLRPDALRILVIDDTPENITSAKQGLAGHRLTTVTRYQDAMDILGQEKFDVVLCDLHLPMSSRTMGDKFKLGELVPYGMLLIVEAAHQGAKRVAVVTDLSHHDDPFSAAFDHFSRYSVKIDGAKVVMMHAPIQGGAKDWASALNQLMRN